MTSTSAPLPRSAPSAQGVDAAGVDRLLDAVADADIEMHSLMVLRHGHVVAEGWWAPFAADLKHLVYSLSKTFTSAAAGLAVAEGRFGLDDVVADHFPELIPSDLDEKYRRYLVRHALSMSSGHEQEALDRAAAASSDADGDLLAGFFRVPPEREPGTIFAYNQPTIYGVGRLVAKTTGGTILDYLTPRLLEPLGIHEAQWMMLGDVEMGFSGIHVFTESLAKTGQLVLDGGAWHGQQILDPAWVAAATSEQMQNDAAHRAPGGLEPTDWQQGYGFQYWMNRHGFRGDGAYGQFIIVWPEEDAVIVTTAETIDMQALLSLITTHLRPAMTGSGTAEADAALAARLASLALPLPHDTGAPFAGTFAADVSSPVVGPFSFGEAVPGAQQVEVVEAGDGWTLRFLGDGLDVALAVGRGAWAAGEWPASAEGLDAVPFRSVAGVDPDGVWRARLRMIQTPHTLQVDIAPGAAATISWRYPPLRGDGPGGHALPSRG
ncbi:beta-lactamase family protein [Microbacterium sp. EYE_5]|uniref:serine hydrolase domain-containing protein n=1 Tax=unclassified Microbacterium TaxID=2609290 RepID=UPI00200415FE|nr:MULTISPECIES: serine hydrolase domain-containing protein [unclassified Microbacterium]MCK6080036.1 beta-lactamase family protein [Microbacterium sp. EYE_382]MCK6085307.1 beta-lactamase family protein [Microbacterium sp. EYE_384]MCK6122468.1 beta-lactamase family protein [Microbacterium sp. EYE_80]MCK6126070.1 beta-lactamase family protein [Microbacterium sp. EYE_79]MCK6140991.1 beta-lactamase family protein [Microbacterium sp. EYE_39]